MYPYPFSSLLLPSKNDDFSLATIAPWFLPEIYNTLYPVVKEPWAHRQSVAIGGSEWHPFGNPPFTVVWIENMHGHSKVSVHSPASLSKYSPNRVVGLYSHSG